MEVPSNLWMIAIPIGMFVILYLNKRRRPHSKYLKWWRVIVPPCVLGTFVGLVLNGDFIGYLIPGLIISVVILIPSKYAAMGPQI